MPGQNNYNKKFYAPVLSYISIFPHKQGGFVHCCNGVWRVQGSLAVSRAIGDQHLKEWIISEPEIKKLRLTSDCEFLLVASDGLWDKVYIISINIYVEIM